MAGKAEDSGDGKKKVAIRTDGSGLSQLPIQKRTFMGSSSHSNDTSAGSNQGTAPEEPHLPPSKKNIIAPLDGQLSSSNTTESPKFMDTKPAKKTTKSTDQESKDEDANDSASAGSSTETNAAPADKENQKGTELSDEAIAKREKEIQDIISSRQYFVPVDAVARRHSDKVSLGMTVVILLLSVVLIDLMLDTGAILLLQKVPHTHFFSIYSENNSHITTKK